MCGGVRQRAAAERRPPVGPPWRRARRARRAVASQTSRARSARTHAARKRRAPRRPQAPPEPRRSVPANDGGPHRSPADVPAAGTAGPPAAGASRPGPAKPAFRRPAKPAEFRRPAKPAGGFGKRRGRILGCREAPPALRARRNGAPPRAPREAERGAPALRARRRAAGGASRRQPPRKPPPRFARAGGSGRRCAPMIRALRAREVCDATARFARRARLHGGPPHR